MAKQERKKRDVQKRRIARKIHGKKIVWIVRQMVQPKILGKIGKELEMVERKKIRGKKNENNCGERRN